MTELNILICNPHNNPDKINPTIISNIKQAYNQIKEINIEKSRNDTIILQVFYKYQLGENPKGDGNCGLYSIINAINDNKDNPIVSIAKILNLL